jgi:hypothetical protein
MRRCSDLFRVSRGIVLILVRIRNATRIGIGVVIHEDAMAISLQVVELTAAAGPEQDADGDESEKEHSGDQTVDHFHKQVAESQPRSDAPNRPRIRAELPMTARELTGIDTAATSGVTKAAIANGTMTTL